MIRSFRSVLFAAAVAATSLLQTTELRAQLGERSRWDQVGIGNNNLFVDVVGWARARDSVQRRVDQMASTNVGFMGSSVELQRIAATAIAAGSSFSGSTSLRRGGLTVRTDVLTNTGTVSYASSGGLWRNGSFGAFGVPLSLSLYLSHTGVMSLTLVNFGGATGCEIVGRMESHPYATAFASVAVPGVQLSVQQDLRIGRQIFQGSIAAFMGYLSTASLTYSLSALRLYLRLGLAFGFVNQGVTLVDAAAASRYFAPFIP